MCKIATAYTGKSGFFVIVQPTGAALSGRPISLYSPKH